MILRRLAYAVLYYLSWVLLFVCQKPIFFFYHRAAQCPDATLSDLAQTVLHGLPLDASAAAYVCVIPFLVLTFCTLTRCRLLRPVLSVYTAIVLFLALLCFWTDLDLYSYWTFRMDSSIFSYLATPSEAAASISPSLFIRQLLLLVVSFSTLFWLYRQTLSRLLTDDARISSPWFSLGFLALAASLFLPMRGGLTDATMNIGWVYFSPRTFLNHTAVNPLWNVLDTMAHRSSNLSSQYRFFSSDEVLSLTNPLMARGESRPSVSVLHTRRPNVILVILESFSAHVIEPLGGEPDVAPRLSRIAREGLLFTQCYANSFRTDRGVACILSGYPSTPRYSIMKHPSVSRNIPNLGNVLSRAGYDLKFYYGGDENFTNMRSYLVSGGFTDIVSIRDFSRSDYSSRWGAADHVVLQRLLSDLSVDYTPGQPFFRTLLTLSSHEPFTVPMPTRFHGDDHDNLYRNSVYYTDSALGDFIEAARRAPWWDSTLIVFVADHSISFPEGISSFTPSRFQIPMIWTGGAVVAPAQCSTVLTQTDFAATLLSQMGLPHDEFIFSHDAFSEDEPHFAYYSYIHGLGFVTSDSAHTHEWAAVDLDADKMLEAPSPESVYLQMPGAQVSSHGFDSCAVWGKAYLQRIFDDLSQR